MLYDFVSYRWQTHQSMPTITLIVKLAGLFYGTQSQSELCVEGLCPVFICVRFKGQGNRKWLSGLWRGWAQPWPGSVTIWHMALGSPSLMKHIQHWVITGGHCVLESEFVCICVFIYDKCVVKVCISTYVWTVVNYLVSELRLFWSWRIVPVPSLLVSLRL